MSTFGLKAIVREGRGKGAARQLRREGFIPAVVYGGEESTALSVSRKELSRILFAHGGTSSVINLDVEGLGKKQVLIRDYQADPVRGDVIHADLLELTKGHKITMTVAIELIGDAPLGVRESQGILQHQMHQIELDCLPSNIPEAIKLDASGLDIGESLHVSDLTLPEGVHVHAAPETNICTVMAPKLKAEDTEEGAEAGTETETETETEED